ncbi:MAG: hypothetical protein KZQ66_17005 [Candidatus Thiodiazotropha sp. (ex Lucinoma aequizonata)]|nr:hypothetical protein [Candidatus Thiodiazotropha sp. (ex Lucinoma aequizonata)]MCU7888707.1 hypothetical protein [Candidatus Thiodiazotropha sp. (ex Lucinoma aequizonata)]MCU7903475.1 hypothetical protein [Candidatus Thiodiazotropha sp. (ex Lucinoma aequizonata)]MCU7907439.1 hypothetical protein [Candidatus Thiodiazotropha sp. (ex Lucinoma aequizonata)]
MVISSLIINTGAIFSCRRIKNDNNFGNYSDEHPITVSPGANQRGEALLSPLPTLKIQ